LREKASDCGEDPLHVTDIQGRAAIQVIARDIPGARLIELTDEPLH
jgi:hypothetical protein